MNNNIPISKISEGKIYFQDLDGLRFFAFLSVFLGHCFYLLPFEYRSSLIKFLERVIGNVDLGVHFFFVLSGFLITYLLLTEEGRFGKIDLIAFYKRRILRIWPVYFVVVLFSLLLSLLPFAVYSLQTVKFGLVLSFLTNFNQCYPGISSVPLSVLWSVAIEEQFYLLFPLLLMVAGKRIFYFFPLIILCSVLYRFYHYQNLMVVQFHSLSVCSSLLVGCCAAYFCLYGKLISVIQRCPSFLIKGIYMLLLLLMLLRQNLFLNKYGLAIDNLVFALIFAFIILEQTYSGNSFYKTRNLKQISKLGIYTYGMYAYHVIVITLASAAYTYWFGKFENSFIYLLSYIILLFLSIIFSKTSYQFLETPFLKMKEKKIKIN